MEIKTQGRSVHDPRGSSATGGSDAYIICGTQARLFNAGSGMATLHYTSDISQEFSTPLLNQLLYLDFWGLNKVGKLKYLTEVKTKDIFRDYERFHKDKLSWFNPNKQLSTKQSLARFPSPSGTGDRIGGKKNSKTRGLK